ncbi:16S rRNA (adenine(1518)-N(6)/adenine(1519)-N(6))-dimethyltransferase RsmA [Candidatus Vondammii sp. HM_W22]|uniref:16S rRNA (adenine(1518)-N(6)/adenine(1519)-N(6))- dimethyltransferase RsmA n=1 Tax=Candidatus Vondammii sp. HM_W22 TaxID=2687299 RepID=UPI001F13DCAE|nr:16S rRNA (adenine(1518)-N(6)/adenine(1519)-N(6))-dimethyltransferase RsmA [Candidatus Vondammii sp. HM_W22]
MTHKARKRFGQNFLHDPSIISRIVRSIAVKPADYLVEIGPGRGAITKELLALNKKLIAIELDRDLVHPLAEMCADLGELEIVNTDALKFDFCSLATENEPLRLIGNLPYNISTPILFHLLEHSYCVHDMHFMLQKEVVDRMAAEPGSKIYGRLTVMLQALCKIEHLFDIGPGAFKPAPKVNSSFVRLVPHRTPLYPVDDKVFFARMITAAFSQRRKTLRNSLRELAGTHLMEEAGIDPCLRAERLALEDFVKLSNLACKTASSA